MPVLVQSAGCAGQASSVHGGRRSYLSNLQDFKNLLLKSLQIPLVSGETAG